VVLHCVKSKDGSTTIYALLFEARLQLQNYIKIGADFFLLRLKLH